MLENLAILFSSIFMMISVFVFGLVSSNMKLKKTIKLETLIYFIVAVILHTIIYVYTDGTAKTLLLCLMYSLFIFLVFNIKYIKSVLCSIIYAILTIVPDLVYTTSVIYIIGISKEYFYSVLAGSIISNFFVNLLMILFIYIIRKPLRKLMNYKLSENLKIIVISIITIIFIAIFFYKFAIFYRLDRNVLLYLIAIIAFMTILFYSFKEKANSENILKRYDVILNTIGEYEKDIEEQRKMVHETRNELMTIRCKIIDKSSTDDIINYLDSIMGDKVNGKMSNYSKFNYLPPNGLKGFLYYKFIEAEKEGISAIINVSEGIKNSFLKDLDTNNFKSLGRILGVYLDNAIEASAKSKEKKLGLEIYLVKNNIKIIISNTYDNKINLDKMGNERISTKGKNRGHGLLLVSKIISENKIFGVKNNAKNGIYTQELIIENPVKE